MRKGSLINWLPRAFNKIVHMVSVSMWMLGDKWVGQASCVLALKLQILEMNHVRRKNKHWLQGFTWSYLRAAQNQQCNFLREYEISWVVEKRWFSRDISLIQDQLGFCQLLYLLCVSKSVTFPHGNSDFGIGGLQILINIKPGPNLSAQITWNLTSVWWVLVARFWLLWVNIRQWLVLPTLKGSNKKF